MRKALDEARTRFREINRACVQLQLWGVKCELYEAQLYK